MPIGTEAYCSDIGDVAIWSGNGWATASQSLGQTAINRLQLQQAFAAGALQAAPAWAATTAYVVNNVVTLPDGKLLVCQTSGTSGSTAPAHSPSNPYGRPLTDGTVTWGGTMIQNANTGELPAELIPDSVTLYSSAAAAGLTETILSTGTGNATLNSNVSCFGGLLAAGQGYQASVAATTFAAGLAAGGGNATAAAVALGYSNLYGYQVYHYDVELYITDTVVALTFPGNSNQPISIEIDGYTVQANPQISGGTAGQCLVVDYGGLPKRRKVRWNGPGSALTIRGYALSTTGYVEPSDTNPADTMLWLGDSIGGSVASDFPASANVICIGSALKRLLGMNVVTVSISGSGYAVANPNEFTMLGVLQNSENQKIFPQYQPSHILHTSGFNDRNALSVNGISLTQVAALAQQAWTLTRQLFPNAKITVTDGFSQAAGPDANGLALAALLYSQWQAWGDKNSRFVFSIGSGTSGSNQAWVRGTAISTGAIGAGNSCWVVGSGGTHSTGVGAGYQAARLAQGISNAWNGQY
jgi:hypothetical protein